MVCPDCLSGRVRTETPTGTVTKIHGLDTYVAAPPDGAAPKALVVMVSDIFGWDFVNSRLLADQYAASGGFLVYLPNFMKGRAAPGWLTEVLFKLLSKSGMVGWVRKAWYVAQIAYYVVPWLFFNRWAVSWPIVRAFFEAVRSDAATAALPVGAAGFCWGAKHCIFLTHPDSVTPAGGPLVDAIFIAHPSVVKYPADVDKVARPASLAIGDKDMTMTMEHIALTRRAWDAKKGVVDTEVVVYPGANHGFAVRVDHFNENLLKHYQEAEEQAVRWFTKHLK
ncbi:Alpha/Beta hydrolase protein [Lasiosphaeria ovina]|uniref:Alpha/Beta hydrolase protein n=1 Tax=Lasiosphaeria ovina TaxID=92902 RepID=A0AAE0MYL0_9PEZI|nr:Alpha/Beta hydrolase protein [Lasiosphaeria ovina]